MIVRRLLPLIVTLCVVVGTACAQGSNDRGAAEVTVKGTKISISYGRPALNGRDLTAQAPVGTVWRLGKNEATEITTSGDLEIAGTKLPAGKYTLWAKKVGDKEWHLAFHPKTGVWGAPPLTEGYVAEMPLTFSSAGTSVEMLTISLSDHAGKAEIEIEWGTLRLTGDLGVG